MKKLLTTALLLVSVIICRAQPVLTAAGINPVPGDTFCIHAIPVAGLSEGDSGVAALWDYSTVFTSGAMHRSFVNCTETPFCDSFPGSDMADSVANIVEYYTCNGDKMAKNGDASMGFAGVTISRLDDAEDEMRYPFTYGSSFTDTSGAYVSGFYTGTVVTARADGYGTLKLPDATYTNALRIHKTVTDYTIVSGAWQNNHQGEYYIWYAPGFRSYVMYVSLDTAGGTSHIIGAGYNSGVLHSLAITSPGETDPGLTMNPNPATDNIHVHFSIQDASDVYLSVMDIAGRQVLMERHMTSGTNDRNIDTRGLGNGVYLVQLHTPGKVYGQKMVVCR